MGKGIATQFKKRFGKIQELYHQRKKPGKVAFIQTAPNINGDRNYIFYMVTKTRYFQKPTYKDFNLSLEKLRDECIIKNIKTISMPRIGCGLDKLDWNIVKNSIEKLFSKTGITVNVYYL